MRAAFSQCGVALPLRARSRNSFRRSAFHDRGYAPKHGSPYIASATQAVITLVIVLLFAGFTAVQVPDANGVPVDTPSLVPYTNIYGLLALIGTAAILLVQAICSAAVIWYFWCERPTRAT